MSTWYAPAAGSAYGGTRDQPCGGRVQAPDRLVGMVAREGDPISLEHLAAHVRRREPANRRAELGLGAKAGFSGGSAQTAEAASGIGVTQRSLDSHDPEGDEMFDVAAVENGAWAPSPYGPVTNVVP